MDWTGYLRPLEHEVAGPITYFVRVGDESVRLNDRLGQTSAHVSQGKSLLPLWAQDPEDL